MSSRAEVALLLMLLAGCGGTTRMVRLETGQGRPIVFTPRHGGLKPVALHERAFIQTLAALGRDVRPSSRPLEDARRLLGVPPRSGAYGLEARSQRLVSLDHEHALASEASSEEVELTHAYLRWCERKARPGDCLRLLEGGSTLQSDGKYVLAMALALDSVWDETLKALGVMVERDAVLATLVSAATVYFMLWVLPEPVSKGVAAAMTAALLGYLGFDTVWGLISGWRRLVDEVDRATSFDAVRAAGERYGSAIGKNAARIFVMLATAAVGSTTATLAAKLPSLPGASQAAVGAESQVGVLSGAIAEVHSVALTAEGATLVLAPGAVAMTARSMGGSGGPRPQGKLTGRPTRPEPNDKRPENIRAIQRENESARTLADNGYSVEQNPPPPGNGKKPDYRIDGEYYDCYAPSNPNPRNIATAIEDKVVKGQTRRIVLNLDDTAVTLEALKQQFQRWPIPGLLEVLVVRGRNVIPLFP